MSALPPHLDDEALAALADGSFTEEAARQARLHLEGCPGCRARAAALDALVRELAAPASVDDARARALARSILDNEAGARRRSGPVVIAPLGVGLAAAAALLWVALPSTPPTDVVAPRGDGAAPEVVVGLYAESGPGTLVAVEEVTSLRPGPVPLATAVSALPGAAGRSVVVYARADDGRVTWLRPAWPEGAAPACVELPPTPTALPLEGVEVPPPSRSLEVVALLFARGCDVARLDQALEAGVATAELPGAPRVLRRERLVVRGGR